jgi:hypothetical protein
MNYNFFQEHVGSTKLSLLKHKINHDDGKRFLELRILSVLVRED